jgi:chromosome segregation ATPase
MITIKNRILIVSIILIFTSCQKGTDYSKDIAKLKSEIEFLKQNNIKYENDLNVLKIQVNSFKLQMDSIKKQTDSIQIKLKNVDKSISNIYTIIENINKLMLEINAKIYDLQYQLDQTKFEYYRIVSSLIDIIDNINVLNKEVSNLLITVQNLQKR